jgi:hypothetical protein
MISAFDCETWPIRPGQKAPRLVSIAFGTAAGPPVLYHREDWRIGWLPDLVDTLREADEIVNQNIGFDFAVLIVELRRLLELGKLSRAAFRELTRLIWAAYDGDRIRDTMVTAMLLAIAKGEPMTIGNRRTQKLPGFSLGDLCEHYLGETVEGKHGPDVWRTRYHELDNVPISDWPPAAVSYAAEDPVYADRLFSALRGYVGGQRPRSECRNVRAAWCMTLAECWGVRTDPRYVRALKTHLLRQRREAYATIRETIGHDGWLRRDGSRDMGKMRARVERACQQKGLKVQRTPRKEKPDGTFSGDQIKTDRPVLESVADVAPDLGAYAQLGATKTELDTFVPALEAGLALPINARWNVLVESERLSCRKPNLTNQPTRGISLEGNDDPIVAELAHDLQARGLAPEIGIRHCFVPRPGWVYAACDYATAELRAFAQVCYTWFGFSAMRDVLVANAAAEARGEPCLDLHDRLSAKIWGLELAAAIARKVAGDPLFKRTRPLSKRLNFGRLGGMGDPLFVAQCNELGVDITLGGQLGDDKLSIAARLKAILFELYPEIPRYFDQIGQWIRRSGGRYFRAVSYGDGLVRGNVAFCDGTNHFFQNLVAQWLKDSLYQACREAYLVETSPFYGCRPVILPHDEIIAEVPEARGHEAATRLGEIMQAAGQRLCPDVPVVVEPALMPRWYKGAEPVYGPDKRLIPWEPKR